VSAVALAILLAACGGGGGGNSGGGGAAHGANPTAQAPSPSPISSPAASGGGAVHIGTRSIPGMGTVLVNGSGLTLYHVPTDTSTQTTCTGGCAQIWPPLLTTSGSAPASPGVMGQFGTLARPDTGTQITFNGMPLYTYIGDTQPGQVNGQGIDGFSAVTS
jgi:predicted lipoprotein with Yx(FWY)xxD motif